ncbi:MAG: hypothetical protein SGI83_07185, partial [Bacteroidota bacterium]|nr:hypothetical protein [Bacteroidota bacterium]
TLLLLLIIVLATSCSKDSYNKPKDECLLTQMDDDAFGTSISIVYNKKGNPESMSFSGFPATLEYDSRKRLTKVNYGTAGVYIDYHYKDNSFLPAVSNYFRPDYGGVIAIDSFQYNSLGQMVKRVITNRLYPIYNSFQKYVYAKSGNVTKVVQSAQNGGTVYATPVTTFEGLQYDKKRNFTGGNQWIKYLFFYSEITDYAPAMFCVNNAVNWRWGYGDDYTATVTSVLLYNTEGFANIFNCHYADSDGYLFDYTRTNNSTCDEPAKPLVHGYLNTKRSVKLSKYTGNIPMTTKK